MPRKTIFWAHLGAGVVAGLVILMMSVTGVILTYERQILAWAAQDYYADARPGQTRLSIDELLARATEQVEFQPGSITLAANPQAPALVAAGRRNSAQLNPYTGDVLQPRNEALEQFFVTVMRIHRWFNVGDDMRDSARAITGASNLLFLFLIVSGLYLWLPRVWRRAALRLRLLFVKAPNSAARDFNWHHVFGFWAALPLLVIVATATVFNYGWANALVYRLAGEEPPQRGAGPAESPPRAEQGAAVARLPLDLLFQQAAAQAGNWNTLTLNLPASTGSREVTFSHDQGTGGQPQKRHGLTLDAGTGELLSRQPFSSQSPGRQARSWVRFLHTGEALGLLGQTIAGLASLAAVFMVWTGMALAWRRLVRGLQRRQASSAAVRSAGEYS